MSVFGKIVTKIFGRKSDKDLKTLYPFVDEINAIYPSFETLSDDDIKQRFQSIKDDLKLKIKSSKATFIAEGLIDSDLDDEILKVEQTFLDDSMAEVFAIVKDVSRRLDGTIFKMMGIEETWRMVHYDVQLIGGVVLHQGRIAEMKTGEGKTLVSTLPIVLNAITGRGVHVITVNDYLAERDSQWMGILFNFLSLSVGCILNQMGSEDRHKMYDCDITYGTNSQFGFDYLRDNMSVLPGDQVQRGHAYAIVDEVDSVLVDEARTPLIISGQVDAPGNQQYTQWRNSIEGILKKQTLLVNTLVSDAEKLLGEDDREAAIKLLLAQRGSPKNRRLMKIFQKQGTQQMVVKMESEYIRDKKLPELDEALYFSIDERSNIIDLSEKGCEYLSPSEPEIFVIPDLGEIFHEIENTPDISTSEILAKPDFSTPNLVLPGMKKALYPGSEHFVSLNHWEETDPFLHHNIIVETVRMLEDADGFITDQIFEDRHHHINLQFVSELSNIIGSRHFIAGPSFSSVPPFLQSRLLDELVSQDVSGVMYDVRDIDPDDFNALQPLAKLKIHAKKRIALIPVVKDEAQKKALTRNIPFEVVCVAG